MSLYRQFLTTAGGMLRPARDQAPILARCRGCSSVMCQPVRWTELEGPDDPWQIVTRCPECNRWQAWTVPHATIEAFDRWLNAGTDRLIENLEQLERKHLEEEAARFAYALAVDAILPEDFGRPA